MKCVIASCPVWEPGIEARIAAATGWECRLATTPAELLEHTTQAAEPPALVFFPHWSARIPPEVYERFECIVFHMTDLPFGRGGSPLQNLIVRGFEQTVLTAFRCVRAIDAGPVYLKRPLSLDGPAHAIYRRAQALIEEMVIEIVRTRPQPVPQQGEPVRFARRTPAGSDLAGLSTLRGVYDHIRMLDADGYPAAFLQCGALRLELRDARLEAGRVVASVSITLHPDPEGE